MIKAIVRNGRLETEEPIDLPDGTEHLIPVNNGAISEEDEFMSPGRSPRARCYGTN